jgi:two-component system C4-dicarboxylate transport sensor histidine kinase DctB
MHERRSPAAGTMVLVHGMTDIPSLMDVKGKPEVSAAVPASARRLVRATATIALVAAASWLGYALAFQRGLNQLGAAAQVRLAVEAARLDGHLARFDYLPSLLETSPSVFQLLGTPADVALRRDVSLYLKSINLLAGADNLYVLGVSGDTLAAADFEEAGTPFGQNLSYRPYVSEALAKGRGTFFGVGITSARAGYYLSYALKEGGATRGVATVKVNLDSFERGWRDIDGDVILLDERGVAILASRDEWRYRPTAPLSRQMQDEISKSKPYANYDLTPLGWNFVAQFSHGAARITIGNSAAYTISERPINHGLWKLVVLDDEAPARQTGFFIGAMSGLASVVALLALGLVEQRRREIKQRLANQAALQAANDMLEIRVQQRTAELRAAQDDLVHAGKLAALGQMSAGIVHELNQPLAALQTAADNAVLLVDRGSIVDARGNLTRIGELVRRLGRLTSQLRVFAYKSSSPLAPVAVEQAVAESLKILAARIKENGVELVTEIDADLRVVADHSRLEQLLCNIVANALDAVESVERKSILIRASRDEDRPAAARIAISNSGPAIAADVLQRMFEPFVTTKPAGKGLGLGLMLSNHIARSFGGELRARNLTPSGAEFVVTLPVAGTSEASHGR